MHTDAHDVIVVGAGPAGSVAAAVLARQGSDVLLLDRQPFPRDKACGDGIPPGTIEILNDIGMADKIRSAGFYTIDRILLGSPRGRIWEIDFAPRKASGQFYIAPRHHFDALVQEHAVATGAQFRLADVRGPLVENGSVSGVHAVIDGREETIRSRVVIGADGATSVIARALRGARPPRRSRGVALRAYVEGFSALSHTVEFYFRRELLPGYAWVFPLGESRANVGVMVRADRYAERERPLRELFDQFLQLPEIKSRLGSDARVSEVATWQLPYAENVHPPRTYDGALLVGDAGSLVDALTGEGIHNAVASGVIAAQAAAGALRNGDVSRAGLAEYDRRCDSELGALIRRSERAQRFLDRFPLGLELLFAGAGAGGHLVEAWINRVSTDFVAGPGGPTLVERGVG